MVQVIGPSEEAFLEIQHQQAKFLTYQQHDIVCFYFLQIYIIVTCLYQPLHDLLIFGFKPALKLSSFTYTRHLVQSFSCLLHVKAPWTAIYQASLYVTDTQSLLKLMSNKSVMPSNHLILCRPLLLLPSVFASFRVYSNESFFHIRRPKHWSFSFSISLSNEYSGLISFRMDWLDLPAVQGTLKSLLQHHNRKLTILWCPAFFIAQLTQPYMTTRKTIALYAWTFFGNTMSLILNRVSRWVLSFPPRSKYFFFLISWLQSPSAVNLEPKKK